nr:translation initiation factor IF-2-like [Pan paniscus]
MLGVALCSSWRRPGDGLVGGGHSQFPEKGRRASRGPLGAARATSARPLPGPGVPSPSVRKWRPGWGGGAGAARAEFAGLLPSPNPCESSAGSAPPGPWGRFRPAAFARALHSRTISARLGRAMARGAAAPRPAPPSGGRPGLTLT